MQKFILAVYVTIQSHGLIAGVRTHYVTANEVRNGLTSQELIVFWSTRGRCKGLKGAGGKGGCGEENCKTCIDFGMW